MGSNHTDIKEKLMEKVDSLHCKGLCQESCGPIVFSNGERERVKKYCEENKLEFHDLNEEYLKQSLLKIISGENAPCPYLKEGKCSIYPVRPMICHLWGAVDVMPCIFGCKPEKGYISREEGYLLLGR